METSTNNTSSNFSPGETQQDTNDKVNSNIKETNASESPSKITEGAFFQKIVTKLDRVFARVMGIDI